MELNEFILLQVKI